jgi:HD-GYP domain-containing protein (c-di-GMP phosphodiesterase class II)
VIGADIVSQMPQFRDLVPLVRNHHERWDGRGYPDGLKGEENVLSARIMCLADSVEAMLSDRPYQATRTLPSVVEEVIRCSGSQFDPLVVDAFLRVVHTRGSDFFVNSASAVARQLEEQGKLETLDGLCYVKKSMIAHQLKAANRNAF